MKTSREGLKTAALVAAAALVLASGAARADGSKQYNLSANYKEECGSCHVAYPPQLLSRDSWQAVMAGLGKHFGTDASLDPAKAREIGDYLAANAGRAEKFAAIGGAARDSLYLSRTPWFRKEHRDGHDGLTAALWASAAVKSPSNCGACHQKAEAGDYGERNIRLPR